MSHMDSQRHSSSVALVTGASSGIGRATALRLAAEGAHVYGCDRNEAGLAELRQEATDAGFELDTKIVDVTKQSDIDALFAAITANGKLDILANVAGIMDWFLPAHEVDDETWDRVMDVNVTSIMRLSRAALPHMMAAHHGAIVNIASIGGLRGGAAGVAYTASKHAVIGVTRSIAWTYQADGIRCNAICPGGVATNIGTTATPRSSWGFERLAKIHAAAAPTAQPDQIASLLSWLASDEASNVNGAIVTDDGGWTAG